MKIICPYTHLSEATEMVLKAEYFNEVRFVDVGGSDEAYFNLVHQLWKEAETFILVEHDIVPWPGAIKMIYDCEMPLCACPAPIGMFNGNYSGMGVGIVKLGKALMQDRPEHLDDPALTKLWHKVDGETWGRLTESGIPVHWHNPPVIHLSWQRFPIKDKLSVGSGH